MFENLHRRTMQHMISTLHQIRRPMLQTFLKCVKMHLYLIIWNDVTSNTTRWCNPWWKIAASHHHFTLHWTRNIYDIFRINSEPKRQCWYVNGQLSFIIFLPSSSYEWQYELSLISDIFEIMKFVPIDSNSTTWQEIAKNHSFLTPLFNWWHFLMRFIP